MADDGDVGSGCFGGAVLSKGSQPVAVPGLADYRGESIALPAHYLQDARQLSLHHEQALVLLAGVFDDFLVSLELLHLVSHRMDQSLAAGQAAHHAVLRPPGIHRAQEVTHRAPRESLSPLGGLPDQPHEELQVVLVRPYLGEGAPAYEVAEGTQDI